VNSQEAPTGNPQEQERSRNIKERFEIDAAANAACSPPAALISESAKEFSSVQLENIARLVKYGATPEGAETLVAIRGSGVLTVRTAQALNGEARAAGLSFADAVWWAARNGQSTFTRDAYAAKGGLQEGGEHAEVASPNGGADDEDLADAWFPPVKAATVNGSATLQ
jgi:hypothetical protein